MIDSFEQYLERTLYHGTTVDNEKSIFRLGLRPDTGSFVRSAYGDDYGHAYDGEHDAIYFADKKDLEKSTSAIVSQIALKLDKDASEVTDQDVAKYGLLCISKDMDLPQADDDQGPSDRPQFAEPYDYYSRSTVRPDQCLKGMALLRFLKSYGVWPIDWTLKNYSPAELKYARGQLVAYAIRRHPERDKKEIRAKIDSLTPRDLFIMLKQYRRNSPRGF